MPRHASPSRKSHAHTVVASLSETPWWLASTTLEFAIIRLACMLTDDCTKIQPLPIHPHNFQMIRVHRLIHQMCFNSEINRPRNQDDENQERPVLKLARALEGASRLPRFEGGIVKKHLMYSIVLQSLGSRNLSHNRILAKWDEWKSTGDYNQQSSIHEFIHCGCCRLQSWLFPQVLEVKGMVYPVSNQIVIKYIYIYNK